MTTLSQDPCRRRPFLEDNLLYRPVKTNNPRNYLLVCIMPKPGESITPPIQSRSKSSMHEGGGLIL